MALKNALQNVDWEVILGENIDIENLSNTFINTIIDEMKRVNTPLYSQVKVNKSKHDQKVERLREKSTKINKQLDEQYLRTRDKVIKLQEIEMLNNKIQTLINDKEERKEEEVISKINSNPRVFYQYAAKNKKVRGRIGPLKTVESYESEPKKMANILSEQYRSVFSTPKDEQFLIDLDIPTQRCPSLDDIQIQNEDIKEAIKDMNSYSAPGPEDLPPAFYKEYVDELATPIKMIWRKSLDTGKTIEGKTVSVITPIYKSGNKSDPSNYRPIALTNHLTKIFERVLKKALVKHLESNNLLNVTQHGFRKGRSTVTQLLRYYDSILSMLVKGLYM